MSTDPPAEPPAQLSLKALLSFVLGFLALPFSCLTGAPALILGLTALRDIDQSDGKLRGRLMAEVGTAAGLLFSLISLVTVGVWLYWLANTPVARSRDNLYRIGEALFTHQAFRGHLPPARFIPSAMQQPRKAQRQNDPLAQDQPAQDQPAQDQLAQAQLAKPQGGDEQLNAAGPQEEPIGLSWRVALLPYLKQERLYEKFRFDQPWNSHHNQKLLKEMPEVYKLPEPASGTIDVPEGYTFYRVFVGPNTIFGDSLADPTPMAPQPGKAEAKGRFPSLDKVTVQQEFTLLVVEAAEAVPWTKPEGLAIPQQPNQPWPQLGGHYELGTPVLTAAIQTQLLPAQLNKELLRASITIRQEEDPRLRTLFLGR